MNKQTISKFLIFLVTASLGAVKAYGSTEVEQSVQTTVPPAVAITKSEASIEQANANPKDGTHSGFMSIFDLQTNGTDNDYDFIITSKILVGSEEVSAYGENGCILFGHTLATPTLSAVENAKQGGSDNKNVIAYPVTVTATNGLTSSFGNNNKYGDCYEIKVNGSNEGTVTHTVGQTPVSGTYSVGQDQSGTYKAVITFSAVSK